MRNTKNSTARKLWNLLNSQEKPVKFTFSKRGQNFGCKLVTSTPLKEPT